MDSNRFDVLTRALSTRRAAISSGLGGLASLLGLAGPEQTAAHNAMAACRRIDDPGKRRACRRRTRAHNRTHRCKPQPVAATCANRCGSTHDNCRNAVNCPCPTGKTCVSNHTCSRTCAPGKPFDCPAACSCGVLAVEGGQQFHCFPNTIPTCAQLTQTCSSTTQCPPDQICARVCPQGPVCVPVCTA